MSINKNKNSNEEKSKPTKTSGSATRLSFKTTESTKPFVKTDSKYLVTSKESKLRFSKPAKTSDKNKSLRKSIGDSNTAEKPRTSPSYSEYKKSSRSAYSSKNPRLSSDANSRIDVKSYDKESNNEPKSYTSNTETITINRNLNPRKDFAIEKSTFVSKKIIPLNTRRQIIEPKSTDWGNVANWYDKMIADTDSYQNQVILPSLIGAMNIEPNDVVLDVGCGVGFFCQKFSELGCKVIGVDLAKESIKIAKSKTSKEITYHTVSSDNLDFCKDQTIDKVVIVLALQNIRELQKTIIECKRVLKIGGSIIAVLNHPYYRIPKNSSWEYDIKSNLSYRSIGRYLSIFETEIDMNPGSSENKVATVSIHRPLQEYINIAADLGLKLASMKELISHRPMDQGPIKTPSLEFTRQEIPLFMQLHWTKL